MTFWLGYWTGYSIAVVIAGLFGVPPLIIIILSVVVLLVNIVYHVPRP